MSVTTSVLVSWRTSCSTFPSRHAPVSRRSTCPTTSTKPFCGLWLHEREPLWVPRWTCLYFSDGKNKKKCGKKPNVHLEILSRYTFCFSLFSHFLCNFLMYTYREIHYCYLSLTPLWLRRRFSVIKNTHAPTPLKWCVTRWVGGSNTTFIGNLCLRTP